MRIKYEKLVRDKIPNVIANSGKKFQAHKLGNSGLENDFYHVLLQRKLKEECKEYFESENIEELADIYEVIMAIANYHGLEMIDIINIANDKYEERGGFEDRVYLEWVGE